MAEEPFPYSLSMNRRVFERFLVLNERAIARGIGIAWSAILRELEMRLRTAPREVGDPIRTYPGLEQVGYRLLFERICLHYSVHESRPLVFLQSIDPVLGHPLEDEA